MDFVSFRVITPLEDEMKFESFACSRSHPVLLSSNMKEEEVFGAVISGIKIGLQLLRFYRFSDSSLSILVVLKHQT